MVCHYYQEFLFFFTSERDAIKWFSSSTKSTENLPETSDSKRDQVKKKKRNDIKCDNHSSIVISTCDGWELSLLTSSITNQEKDRKKIISSRTWTIPSFWLYFVCTLWILVFLHLNHEERRKYERNSIDISQCVMHVSCIRVCELYVFFFFLIKLNICREKVMFLSVT